jgi:DNA polymerase III sliding clamp (beta) subunit (PCNA family)
VLDASYEFLADADGEPDANGFRPEGLEVAFNPQYLLDGLAAIDSDTARLSFTKPGKAVLITGKPGPEGENDFRYLLMPIRLGA